MSPRAAQLATDAPRAASEIARIAARWGVLVALICGCRPPAAPDRTEVQARYASATDAFKQRQYEQAREHLTAALEMGGLSADQLVDAYVRRAVCRARAGDTAGAHADLDFVANDAPNVDLIYSARSFVYRVEGKSAEAAAVLAKARALNSNVEVFEK